MLSDSDRELLTGFLDGQLGPRERTAALRLLQQSSEARQMLRQMQEDSHALRGLPRQGLPADFAVRVMRVAAERGLRPGVAPKPLRPRLSVWARLAAAAAVLLAVGGGALLLLREQTPSEGLALVRPDLPLPPKDAPPPEPGLRLALRDLDRDAARARLTKELRKGPAYHLDLDSGDTARTVKHLEAAFRAGGVQLLVDPRAGAALARRDSGKRYVVYAENLRPEELAEMLRRLGREEKAVVRRNDLDHDSVLVNPLSAQDRKDLANLLGIAEAKLHLPRVPAIPLSEPPIHVPGKQQGKEPSATGKAPKAPARFAVVLPDEGGSSPVLQRFLASRRHHYTGTLQLYLVIHDARV